MNGFYIEYIDSPIGRIEILASSRGVTEICVTQTICRTIECKNTNSSTGINYAKIAADQLLEYFIGNRTIFDVPLSIEGTPFQSRVWETLLTIPYGHTYSYKELASKAGSPKGFRATGQACGANPIPIIIPCHRVLTSDGRLGGYSEGLYIKKWLLTHELRHMRY